MQGDAVDTHDWMSGAEFANAVAYGQLTPGPVIHTVAMVGWAAAGFGGALLAAAIAFAPSFLVILVLGDRFAALRESAAGARVPRRRRPGRGRRDPRRSGAAVRRARGVVAVRGAGRGRFGLILRRGPFWVLVGGAGFGLVASALGAVVP